MLTLVLAGCFSEPERVRDGDYANGHVSTVWSVHPRMRIDIISSPGISPAKIAIDGLLANMHEQTEYGLIEMGPSTTPTSDPSQPRHKWTAEELYALVAAHRTTPAPVETTVFQVFYLEGSYPAGTGGTGSALGVEVDGAIVLFPDPFRQDEPVSRASHEADDRLERAVLVHELGHAMGLVDGGAPLTRDRVDREDPCECHSTNPGSVMSTSPELSDIGLNLLGVAEMPWQFDDDDLADLAALRAISHDRIKHRS